MADWYDTCTMGTDVIDCHGPVRDFEVWLTLAGDELCKTKPMCE